MRFNTLNDWLTWQESLHPSEIELGLSRVEQVLTNFFPNTAPFTVITVAGTNGKGSTVAFLEAILNAAGYKVGCYTSPHFLHYNERVRINGENSSDTDICEAFEEVDQARLNGSDEIPLTYFEFGTLAALSVFQRQSCEVVVLEVGLGGRLDAVNVIDPDVALVTTVDLDHQDWLGDTIDAIATEKAGIYRADKPALFGDEPVPQGLLAVCESLGITPLCYGRDFGFTQKSDSWDCQLMAAQGQVQTQSQANFVRHDLPLPRMKGNYQLKNATNALMVLEQLRNQLPVSQSHIRQGLLQAKVIGRFEVIGTAPLLIADVAHNPQAARALAANLKQYATPGYTRAIVGMLADKDSQNVIEILADEFDSWHIIELDTPRALPAETLSQQVVALTDKPVSCHASFKLAYDELAAQAGEHDRLVVFGSFYTVSQALESVHAINF